jgi:hypothetical protein
MKKIDFRENNRNAHTIISNVRIVVAGAEEAASPDEV